MLHSTVRALGCGAVVGFAMLTIPAQAAFHLWNIQEIYTDGSGSLQFVEMFVSSDFQNSLNGQQINVSNVGATQTHNFTISGSTIGTSTANHTMLFGTASLQAAGGPTPDFIIPNNFLFAGGGTINFFGVSGNNPVIYSALPTDGVHSRITFGGSGDAINSPQNFAGQTGTVVPEPAISVLFGLAGFGLLLLRRRSA